MSKKNENWQMNFIWKFNLQVMFEMHFYSNQYYLNEFLHQFDLIKENCSSYYQVPFFFRWSINLWSSLLTDVVLSLFSSLANDWFRDLTNPIAGICSFISYSVALHFLIMDDEAETYKLWRIRKTVLQVERKNHWFEI